MKPTAGLVVEPTRVIASEILGITMLNRKQTMMSPSVVRKFSFFDSLLSGLPLATISSTVSLAGRTTKGAAVAMAKNSAKLPIRMGMTSLG